MGNVCATGFVCPDAGGACITCATISAPHTLLLGEPCLEPTLDGESANAASAFAFTASASGTSGTVYIYLSGAQAFGLQLQLGIYADDGQGQPGGLMGSAWITAPNTDSWNSVAVPFAALTQGTQYWLAVLATSNNLSGVGFLDDYPSASATATYSISSVSSLPSAWPAGSFLSQRGPISAYVTN